MAGRPAVGGDTCGQLATPLPAATGLRCRHLAPPSVATARAGLPAVARGASEGWSGRRGSNPRPTAWKAVTLPLSYSRLREPFCPFATAGKPASSDLHPPEPLVLRRPLRLPLPQLTPGVASLPAAARRLVRSFPRWRAKAGGEGRIRTSEAARATDLQSVAFDRSATSPMHRARHHSASCSAGVEHCRNAPSSRYRRLGAASISAPPVKRTRDHQRPVNSRQMLARDTPGATGRRAFDHPDLKRRPHSHVR